MSGMHANQAYNWERRFMSIAKDVYNSAILFHWSHKRLLENLEQRLYSLPAWKKAPRYARAYVTGWMLCRADHIWEHQTVWVMSVDGQLLTGKEIDALTTKEKQEGLDCRVAYRSPWGRIESEKSCHVWRDAAGNPMRDKPYT